MSPRHLLPLVALVLAPALGAQVPIHTGPFANSGANAHKNMVRDAQGRLFCLLISQDPAGNRPLILYLSTDQGQTWNLVPFTFNDASSGLNPPNPTSQCNMAIDDRGVLHVIWGGYYYPSNFYQYYRNYDPTAGTASQIVDLNTVMNAVPSNRTAAMDIVVDQANTVWIAARSNHSWVAHLIHSTQPYAAGLTFADVGAISPSASAQNARLAVDTQGRIHCSYYRNTGAGIYEHRYYDPQSTWGIETMLGNNVPTNDYYGMLASDALGNVHALYVKDAHSSSAVWHFCYRRWDGSTGTWGSEVSVFDATQAQFTGIANYRIIALACNEATGKAFVVYRDLSQGGGLRIAEKGLNDPGFSNLPDLAPPTMGVHEYYLPTIRGRLNPAFDNTGGDLDITWRQNPSPGPYALVFDSRHDCSGRVARHGTGCADAAGVVLQMSYSGAPCLGSTFNLSSNTAGPAPYYLVLGASDQLWLGLQLPLDLSPFGASGCSVYCSHEILEGPFPAGTPLPLAIPNSPFLSGSQAFLQHYVLDGAIANPLHLAVSDMLGVTIGS